VWAGIKARCFNPKSRYFQQYGGRGISMWEAWVNDFAAFYQYVSGLPNFGVDEYTLDRIDNNNGYVPGNLRWTTKQQQARNTRRNRLITINGVARSISEWSEVSGIPAKTIQYRVAAGWSAYDAVYKPLQLSKSHRKGSA